MHTRFIWFHEFSSTNFHLLVLTPLSIIIPISSIFTWTTTKPWFGIWCLFWSLPRYSLSNPADHLARNPLTSYLVSFSSLEQATHASQQRSTSFTIIDHNPWASTVRARRSIVDVHWRCESHPLSTASMIPWSTSRLNIMEAQTTEIEEDSTMQMPTNDKAVRSEISAQRADNTKKTISSLHFRHTFCAFYAKLGTRFSVTSSSKTSTRAPRTLQEGKTKHRLWRSNWWYAGVTQ